MARSKVCRRAGVDYGRSKRRFARLAIICELGMSQGPVTPRRGYPRWHYTPRGTWDAEGIVAALQGWAKETGAPPLSWEWCPGAARSAGLMSDAESKWEREHPRWPGNTTVYRYFHSWPAALHAAGLSPPTTEQLPMDERVARANAMATGGVSAREIARELSVTPATVYRYLKAHPCSTCGGPVVGDGSLCQRCTIHRSNPKRWSAQELLLAVSAWEELEGRPPAQIEWRSSTTGRPNRWQREFPRWPPASAARVVFGSWTEMILIAGYPPYNLPWSRDEVIDALPGMAHELGRAPTKEECDESPDGCPSASTVKRRFGSFTAGIRAAGLEPGRGGRKPRHAIH